MTTPYLGQRDATGTVGPDNRNRAGGWVVTFDSADLYPQDFEVYHIAVRGPGGNFLVYIDNTFYSATDRGDINEYDPVHPMFVRRGQSVSFHWSIGTGTAPQVWMFARQPESQL